VKSKLVVAALVAGLSASPAWGQEEEKKHFDGPRIEALFGYDQAKLEVPAIDPFEEVEGDAEDIFYGAAIGYDFQSGMFTFGAEAEIAGSALSDELGSFSGILPDDTVFSGTGSVGSATEYYFGGRVGFVGGRSLFYVKAGYALSGVDIELDGTFDDVAGRRNGDVDLDGLRLGVGYEYKVTDLVYLKAEYRYTDFSGGELDAFGASLEFGDVFEVVNLERHQAVVGAGVRF